jgi:hypothetical protein
MHMTTKNSVTGMTSNQNSIWGHCAAIASLLTLADVMTGGLVRESIALHKLEYVLAAFAMIATVGVYASDGTSGVRFARSYSRHKL